MKYGCIGEKLGHSFSCEIHAMLGSYEYELCELAPDALDDFFAKRDFLGINVTIPYKKAVIKYLDYIDDNAKRIGAVNTIVNKDGCLYGYNTDFYGMNSLLKKEKISIKGKRVAVLGTGGTSKTAVAVARANEAEEIVRVSRTPSAADEISYEDLSKKAFEIIINTTPVGMFPKSDVSAVDIKNIKGAEAVVDAIYHPLRTKLVCSAQESGIKATGGLYMLVAQAAKAAQLFFNDESFLLKTDDVYEKLLEQKQNIVLIGMPGCGKTTLGTILKEKLNKPMFDSDRVFEERHGKIADYFKEFGEEAFRKCETAILAELGEKNGIIIACGGGAVVKKQNIDMLKRNGVIVFIDRPIESLVPTSDRPLTPTRAALEQKYSQRYPLYCSAADIHINAYGNEYETAQEIINTLKGINNEKISCN